MTQGIRLRRRVDVFFPRRRTLHHSNDLQLLVEFLLLARRWLARVLAVVVCLSVTSRCSTETAKRRITQTTPHDTPRTL